MAARDPSQDGATVALSDEFDPDQPVNIVSVDGYSFDQIVEHIVDARRYGTESILSLRCPADVAWDLGERLDKKLEELDQLQMHRFEYDYQSGIAYIDIMPETQFHYQFQVGSKFYAEVTLARFLATIPDPAVRQHITQSILDFGTSSVAEQDAILKQGDFGFGTVQDKIPRLVGEVAYGESRGHVERKVVQYIECSGGKIQATIAFKAQYPEAKWIVVYLRVADGNSAAGSWVQYGDTIYNNKLSKQPDGHVSLYVSDFVGPVGLPADLCRPSAAELAAGVSRVPQVILTYERLRAIFLRARAIYQGTYQSGGNNEGQEEENIFTLVNEAVRERQHADEERQRADEERQRADKERQRAAEERQRAHQERQRAKEAERRVVALEERLRFVQQ